MKIVTLNIWGGRVGAPLLEFFRAHPEVEVFLLQEAMLGATERTRWEPEVHADIFQEIAEVLPEYVGTFAPSVVGEWGLAAFVKKSVTVDEMGVVFVHKHMDSMVGRDGKTIGRNLQFIKLMVAGKRVNVLNVHGIWTGDGKDDTAERLEQSRKIIEFAKTLEGEIVLGGDFNLNPETESLRMIERELGLRNLIKENGVTSTRTSYYTKPLKFADYILVSPRMTIKQFEVMKEEVSDHAAVMVEII